MENLPSLDSVVLGDIGQAPNEFVLTANIYSRWAAEVKSFFRWAGIFS